VNKNLRNYLVYVLGGMTLVILIALLWYNWPSRIAKRICQEAEKEHLRSPSTAQFGPSEWEGATISKSEYEVRGWVDAANVYGTPIRNYYLCMVKIDDEVEIHLSETKFESYHERLRQGLGPI
jgi:hypothetical protein